MKREIIVKGKKYVMPKMSIATYLKYIEVRDSVMSTEEKKGLYTSEQFTQMLESICNVYGNQFAVADLLDDNSGLSVTDVIMEFAAVEMEVGKEVERRTDKLTANFTNGGRSPKSKSNYNLKRGKKNGYTVAK